MSDEPPNLPQRTMRRRVARLCCVFLFLLATVAASAGDRYRVAFAEQPPKIDGVPDEPVWEKAEVLDDFFQYEPVYGAAPSERTEVRVLYDYSNLYVAFVSYGNDAEVFANVTRRDAPFMSDDFVGIYLDTFFDRRNAYAFFVNALGTQRDMRIVNEGFGQQNRREGNASWDCTWEAKAARFPDRWTVEMAIPFAELRFDPNGDVWGANFVRNIEIREETVTWSDVGGRQYNVSRFNTLVGMEVRKLDRGQSLFLTPYGTFSPRDRTGAEFELAPKVGLDLRYPMTSFTIDATLNPDYAQIEADPTRVNLTDIELRFPEKRPFFLEGGDLYRTPIEVFYTRRVEDLDLGVKAAGRMGNQDIAFMTAFASPFDPKKRDREGRSNYTAFRYQKEVSSHLGVGLIAVNKQTPRLGRWNGAGGVDFTLRLPRDVTLLGQYVESWFLTDEEEETFSTPGEWVLDRAYVVRAERRTPSWSASGSVFDVGPKFRTDSGFIPRTDRRGFRSEIGYSFQKLGFLTRAGTRIEYERLTDSTGRLTNERVEWSTHLGAGNFFLFAGPQRYYRVRGERSFVDETVMLFTGWFPPRYVEVRLFQNFGYFEGERRWFFSPNVTFRPTESLSIEYSLQREARRKSRADGWYLRRRVQRLQMRYQFSQRSFLSGSAEVTQDDESRFFILYGTEYRPKSFLFLVYNEKRFTIDDEAITDRALFLKLSYQTKVW